MGSKKRSKPFRSKWPRATNTLEIASSRVARLPRDFLDGLAISLERSAENVAVAEHSAQACDDLRFACVVSCRIERQGVVKGLLANLEEAFDALESIRQRCMVNGVWHHCPPTHAEVSAVREMTELHAFQLRQLSVSEFDQVVLAARGDMATLPKIQWPAADELEAA